MTTDVAAGSVPRCWRLKDDLRAARLRAHLVVNTELLELCCSVGDQILQRQRAEGWGTGVIQQLAEDLRAAFPDVRGFSRRNIFYMRAMAKARPDREVVQQLVAQLPWGYVTVLVDRLDRATRSWYAGSPGRARPVTKRAPEPG